MKPIKRSRIVRRTGVMILFLLCFFCLCASAKGRAQENTGANVDRVEQILSEMTLKDKVEQMMIVSFREWKESPAPGDDMTVKNKEPDEQTDNVTEDAGTVLLS